MTAIDMNALAVLRWWMRWWWAVEWLPDAVRLEGGTINLTVWHDGTRPGSEIVAELMADFDASWSAMVLDVNADVLTRLEREAKP